MALFECINLSKKYGKLMALDDVTFSIEPGRITGLLGPNGSGKTTLIKMANVLLTPTSGSILIDGNKPGVKTKKIVSYLPDRISLAEWMSANELVLFYRDFFDDFSAESAEKMLKELEIDDTKPIKNLSKGTREKVQLILTMSRNARLYFLDEPIGGVDPATRDYILRTIVGNYNPEASIILSTHLISDVEKILDDVLFLDHGKIVINSSVDKIREDNGKSVDGLFREVFRC